MDYCLIDNHTVKLLKEEMQQYKHDKSCKFFEKSQIKELNNNNILALSNIRVIYNDNTGYRTQLEQIKLENIVGLDIETDGLNPRLNKIVGIGLSDGKRHYYIQLDKDISTEHKMEISSWLKSVIFKSSSKILCHNAKFEYSFIKCFFNIKIPKDKLIDTMVYAYILGLDRKLSTLANKYLDRYPLDWDGLCNLAGTKEAFDIPIELIAPYCAEDALECVLLLDVFLPYISFYYGNSRIPSQDNLNVVSISNMELEGIKVDFTKVEPLLEYCEDLIINYKDEIYNLSGDNDINIDSPQQLQNLLFNKLKLPTDNIKKNKTGFSVDKNTISELMGLHPIIESIQDYQLVKSVKRYLVSGKEEEGGLINMIDWDDMIYPNTNNCLTDTGRLSMSKPNLQQAPNPSKYMGLNNKNIAVLGKKFRELFIPRKDNHWFVIADYPSFEFRILATLSNDATLLNVFRNNLDFHIIICEKLFNIKYDKTNPLHVVYRTVTKTINYGVAYGMTWLRLQRECLKVGLNFSRHKCQQILADYWAVLHGVYVFFCREKLKALKHGYSETAWGRKRYYDFSRNHILTDWCENNLTNLDIYKCDNSLILEAWEELDSLKLFTPDDESKFRTIQNNPMQGTNADVVRLVLNSFDNTWTELVGKNGGYCKTVLTVHDEFLVEASHENVNYAKDIMKDIMENSIELLVPLPVKPVICKNWAEGK